MTTPREIKELQIKLLREELDRQGQIFNDNMWIAMYPYPPHDEKWIIAKKSFDGADRRIKEIQDELARLICDDNAEILTTSQFEEKFPYLGQKLSKVIDGEVPDHIVDQIVEPEKRSEEEVTSTPEQEISITNAPDGRPWDLVIMGAGPIGLTAAKVASQYGLQVLILEQSDKCGSETRAETVESHPLFDELWEKDFMNDLTIETYKDNMFYSPLCEKNDLVTMIERPHSFHWREFIDKLYSIVTNPEPEFSHCPSVTFSFNTIASELAPISKKYPDKAVTLLHTNKGHVLGHTFFDCTGHKSNFIKQVYLDQKKIVYPIIKSQYSDFPYSKYPHFLTFFIAAGTVQSVNASPPAMIVIFPNKTGKAEINCQIFDEYGPNGDRLATEPEVNKEYIEKMWHGLKTMYPVFSDIMKGLTKDLEFLTGMPSKSMLENGIYRPGLVHIGDCAGFVRPNSSSGLVTGMKAAQWWAHVAYEMRKSQWGPDRMRFYNTAFSETDFYQDLADLSKKVRTRKNLIYKTLCEPGKINYQWNIITGGYARLEKKDAANITSTEFYEMKWDQKVAVINALVDARYAFDKAEKKVVEFLGIAKETCLGDDWEAFLSELDVQNIFKKVQGKEDLYSIYQSLGAVSRVICSIAKRSKSIITRDANDDAIIAASIGQRGDLINILLNNRPLLDKGEERLVRILEITNDENDTQTAQLAINAGGYEAIYDCVQSSGNLARLRKVLPYYKTCPKCEGEGKIHIPKTCPECNGIKTLTTSCVICGGDGQTNDNWPKPEKCPNCGGSGLKYHDCLKCGGDGWIKDNYPTPENCWACGGDGKNYWGNQCKICGGDGKINDNWPKPETCPNCNGSGKKATDCIKCGGDGWIKDNYPKPGTCWNCNGSGNKTKSCWRCGGDGEVNDLFDEKSCTKCNGTGEIQQ